MPDPATPAGRDADLARALYDAQGALNAAATACADAGLLVTLTLEGRRNPNYVDLTKPDPPPTLGATVSRPLR